MIGGAIYNGNRLIGTALAYLAWRNNGIVIGLAASTGVAIYLNSLRR